MPRSNTTIRSDAADRQASNMTEAAEIARRLSHLIQHAESLTARQRADLSESLEEIVRTLHHPETDSAGLAAQLIRQTERFAETHPRLTRTAGQWADMLSQMGI